MFKLIITSWILMVLITGAKTLENYHLKKINNNYQLVDPNGVAFFSLGINHIQALSYPTPLKIFKDKYKSDWSKASTDIQNNMLNWGFNTAGYGTPRELRKLMPYMMPSQPLVKNSAYLGKKDFAYSDIFNPLIQKEILKKIKNMTKEKNNPNLIGYYWTDTPMWDLKKSKQRFGINWVEYIKSLPKESPGRIKYEIFKKENLLKQYPSKDSEFLRIIAKEYYSLIGKETRRLDPNTLIFGERYLMDNHPIEVIEEAIPYIDVLSIQPNGCSLDIEYCIKMYKLTNKPILICDHQCSFPTEEHKHTMWKQLEDQITAAKNYKEYILNAVNQPYIIGYHRCQYIDRYNHSLKLLKQGMIKGSGEAYEPHAQIITEANNLIQSMFKKNRLDL